jgi:outer membrane immunogenic protein
MRRLTLVSTLLLTAAAFSQGALAADLPVKAAPLAPMIVSDPWTGFYIGATAGYGSGTASNTLTANAADNAIGVGDPVFGPFPGRPRMNGFVGGGEVGYNQRFGNVLAGVEADISYASLRGSSTATGVLFIGGIFNTTVDAKVQWFGTVRGRFGFLATNDLLIYGTGGLAYANAKTTVTGINLAVACPFNNCFFGSSGSAAGWTAGGGVEYAFLPHWTIKAEYLYLDFGNRSFVAPDAFTVGGAVAASTHLTVNVVRGGLNFHF